MFIISIYQQTEIIMSNLDEETKKTLSKIFKSEFKNLKVHEESDDHASDNLLGAAVLRRIRSIEIKEIDFGKLLQQFNTQLESSMNQTYGAKIPKYIRIIFSKTELSAVDSIDSAFKIASRKDSEIIKSLVQKIDTEIAVFLEQRAQLNKELVVLKQLIDDQPENNDPDHGQRMNLLRQVYAFNLIRVQSVENLIKVGGNAVSSGKSYLQFTKPNIDFALESKVRFADFDAVMRIFRTKFLPKVKIYNITLNILQLVARTAFLSLLFYSVFNQVLIFANANDSLFVMHIALCFLSVGTGVFGFFLFFWNLDTFYPNNYLNVYEFKKYDYEKYEQSSNNLNRYLLGILVPFISIFPFFGDVLEMQFVSYKYTLLWVLAAYILWKLINMQIKRSNKSLLEFSNHLFQVHQSHAESK